jgi:rubrerythrin
MNTPLNPNGEHDVLTAWAAPEIGVPMVTEDPAGSPLDRLLAAFERHIVAEADTVTAYRALADTTADPVVALLMQQVVEDEDRHHGLLRSMAARLRDALHWTHSPDALPVRGTAPEAEAGALLAPIREFARQEHEGARQARELAKEQAGLYDGLFTLLLETMAADSEKHERILSYIARRTQEHLADA